MSHVLGWCDHCRHLSFYRKGRRSRCPRLYRTAADGNQVLCPGEVRPLRDHPAGHAMVAANDLGGIEAATAIWEAEGKPEL